MVNHLNHSNQTRFPLVTLTNVTTMALNYCLKIHFQNEFNWNSSVNHVIDNKTINRFGG